jgi:PDZ domain-containing protein
MKSGVPLWPLFAVSGLLVVAASALGLWNLALPYYAFSQGPVGDALEAIEVEEVEVYPPGGELLMLTVSSQGVNPYEALVAALDSQVDLVPREAVRRADETDEDFTRRNLESMDASKETAIAVALKRLGYELEFQSNGVRIASLVETAPAAKVLRVGDFIQTVDGHAIRFSEDVAANLQDHLIGDMVEIAVRRDGEEVAFPIELVAHVDDPERPMIGITAETVNLRPGTPPFPIDIDAGLIGGPSAGMMYALAIIDVLSPGNLTGGHVVAGTGTIDPEGRVGNIGGIRQKVVAAEAAGAEFVLVPEGNYEEARSVRTRRVQIVPVATIDYAIDFLTTLPAI